MEVRLKLDPQKRVLAAAGLALCLASLASLGSRSISFETNGNRILSSEEPVDVAAKPIAGRNAPGRLLEENGNNRPTRPLLVLPLLKELGAGWGNMEVPQLLQKDAVGTRSLVINVGLDAGDEFFAALDNGFEVVGFEPNPIAYQKLLEKCRNDYPTTCVPIPDLSQVELPLRRKEGVSYLIKAAAGEEPGQLPFYIEGPVSTMSPGKQNAKVAEEKGNGPVMVDVVRIDSVIQEDVYLFMVDVQGFESFVLKGASVLFERHTVRQLVFEVDGLLTMRNNVRLSDIMDFVQDSGFLCFSVRNDLPGTGCKEFLGETVEEYEGQFFNKAQLETDKGRMWSYCFDEFLCVNVERPWAGPTLMKK